MEHKCPITDIEFSILKRVFKDASERKDAYNNCVSCINVGEVYVPQSCGRFCARDSLRGCRLHYIVVTVGLFTVVTIGSLFLLFVGVVSINAK